MKKALSRKAVSLKEYAAAKAEILKGVEFKEHTEHEDGKICKTYTTKKNGVFHEIHENGIVEFWSDKYSESRYFDDRSREEIIEQYEERLDAKDKLILTIVENNKALDEKLSAKEKECIAFLEGMNENGSMVIRLKMQIDELKEKLSAINALSGVGVPA